VKRFTRRKLLKGSLALTGGVALAPFWVACGNRQQAEAELVLDPDERVSIGYWYFVPAAFAELVEDLISSFEKEKPNIDVEGRGIPGNQLDVARQVQAALAAGDPPAVATVGGDVLRYTADSVPHLSIEAAARRAPQGERWLSENFPDNILHLGRADGELHFMPYSISTPLLFCNEDALRQAGLQAPPRTWEEVREHARRLTEETDLLGFSVAENADFWLFQGIMECNGARVLVESGEGIRCGVDSPEAVEAVQLVADMVLEDETAAYDLGLRGYENFAAGRVAMVLGSSGGLGLIQGAGFPFRAAPFPTFGDKPRRIPAGLAALGIFAEEEAQQAAAWEFIRFLLSPEALTTWDEGTAFLPPRRGIAEDPQYLGAFYEENPVARVALEQLPDAVPWASFPGEQGLQAFRVLADAMDRIFAGEQDVAEALGDAAQRINQMIQR
jgi:multiple sugar transport system substrate-binding protein